MADIFISYASEDRNRAETLATILQDQGWSVWWDRDLPFGRPFDEVIRTELQAAGCVVALWTESAANSWYVIGEARDGMRLNKLISVFLENIHSELPYDLQAIHGVELIDWHGETSNTDFQRLITGITTLVGSSQLPEPPEVDKWKLEETEPKIQDDKNRDLNSYTLTEEPSPNIVLTVKRRIGPTIVAVALIAAIGFIGGRLLTSEPKLSTTSEREQIVVAHPKTSPAPKSVPGSFTNSTGMKFVYIAPGKFIMGSPEYEPGRGSNEQQHQVDLTQGFYMQTTEVTQGQWQAVLGSNPSHFKNCGKDCPVENVSWIDVQNFIEKLNTNEGIDKYRLPTEAEWEYAARAGTTTPFAFGRCLSTDQANYDGDKSYEGCPKGQNREKTVAVGSFQSNGWGLYDMHGNVYEWVKDDWENNYTFVPDDGSAGINIHRGLLRVIRGGSWFNAAGFCRSASRVGEGPGERGDDLGFRLVLLPGQEQ